jgi:hypothetical protein
MLYSPCDRSFTGQVAVKVPTCANPGWIAIAIAGHNPIPWMVDFAGSAGWVVVNLLLVGAFTIDQP